MIPHCRTYIEHENCIEFYFATSPWPFFVSHKTVEILGGNLAIVFNTFSQILRDRYQPRKSSKQNPYSPLDLELSRRNQAMGKRHWQYQRNWVSGNWSYHGYGHRVGEKFQFYDWNPERPSGNPV